MSKHLCGPWDHDGVRVRKDGKLLVTVWDYEMPSPDDRPKGESWMDAMSRIMPERDKCRETSVANARLIAAAPDLLEAAHAAYDLLKLTHDETGKVGTKLRAAIAKATGEE